MRHELLRPPHQLLCSFQWPLREFYVRTTTSYLSLTAVLVFKRNVIAAVRGEVRKQPRWKQFAFQKAICLGLDVKQWKLSSCHSCFYSNTRYLATFSLACWMWRPPTVWQSSKTESLKNSWYQTYCTFWIVSSIDQPPFQGLVDFRMQLRLAMLCHFRSSNFR